jgi:hypothetical protein
LNRHFPIKNQTALQTKFNFIKNTKKKIILRIVKD